MKIQDALDLHLKEEASRIIGDWRLGANFNKTIGFFTNWFVEHGGQAQTTLVRLGRCPKCFPLPALCFDWNQHAQGLVGVREHLGFAYGKSMRGGSQTCGGSGNGSKKDFAISHETIDSRMGLCIGISPLMVLRYRANEGPTSV